MRMIFRLLMAIGLGKLINKGINHVSTGGKSNSEMTPAERAKAAKTRATVKRARQAARISRKFR